MSRETNRLVVVAAIAVLVLSMVGVWSVADVRADRESAAAMEESLAPIAERQAPADYDGDGIADSSDVCPTRAETENGFQDGDGCPDVVATTRAS